MAVALRLPTVSPEEADDHLNELTALADSLGITITQRIIQSRSSPEAATWIGAGKAQEVKTIAEAEQAGLVIFDDELSPAQMRNLEKIIGVRIVTRTELILDIFAWKAKTYEAKLQVEMAQLEYSLTRVRHLWSHLEGQRGGIGVRGGAGETQIEVDKRQIRTRISTLRKRLEEIRGRRIIQRSLRLGFPVGAVVGYTNVGKSTLINAITGEDQLHTENKLFATLDSATRRVELAGKKVLLTDTVGFIRKFPPQLAASFRSTIEEAIEADFLVHVADVSHPGCRDQIATVEAFLKELGAGDKPTVKLLNKADLVKALDLRKRLPSEEWIPISAKTGAGMAAARQAIRTMVPA